MSKVEMNRHRVRTHQYGVRFLYEGMLDRNGRVYAWRCVSALPDTM